MGNRSGLTLVALCALFLFAAGGAQGGANVAAAPGSQAEADTAGRCLAMHYPAFKGGRPVWGFMPGSVEQEAICRIDAICINPADNSGLCRDGRIAVRRLPPPVHSPPAEGAGFLD